MLITKKITITLVTLLFGFLSFQSNAQVEKCQDKEGKWHYGSGLGSVCENSSEIKQVKTDNISRFPDSASNNINEQELARLELKVIDQEEYIKEEIDKILAPYKTEQDVQDRFDRLKASTSKNVIEKTNLIQAINSENKQLRIEKGKEQDEQERKNIDVKIADNSVKISLFQSEISQFNNKLNQIDQRRAKVLFLFKQFIGRKAKQG